MRGGRDVHYLYRTRLTDGRGPFVGLTRRNGSTVSVSKVLLRGSGLTVLLKRSLKPLNKEGLVGVFVFKDRTFSVFYVDQSE